MKEWKKENLCPIMDYTHTHTIAHLPVHMERYLFYCFSDMTGIHGRATLHFFSQVDFTKQIWGSGTGFPLYPYSNLEGICFSPVHQGDNQLKHSSSSSFILIPSSLKGCRSPRKLWLTRVLRASSRGNVLDILETVEGHSYHRGISLQSLPPPPLPLQRGNKEQSS